MVVDEDENLSFANLSFMEKICTRPIDFKWPSNPDELWVKFNNILCVIKEQSARGGSNRLFHFNNQTMQMITDLFESWQSIACNFRYHFLTIQMKKCCFLR